MPAYCSSIQAAKAPIMNSAPCAKLMMFSMPKITASPSDSIAKKAPLISPSSSWPNRSGPGMPKIMIMASSPSPAKRGRVGVGVPPAGRPPPYFSPLVREREWLMVRHALPMKPQWPSLSGR